MMEWHGNLLRKWNYEAGRSIPGLDGMRAISILLVLVAHLTGTTNFPRFAAREVLGELGVRVFFVISGFLVTTILLRDAERNGRICLFQFLLRRSLRLLPACYFLIAAVVVLSYLHIVPVERLDLIAAATFLMNYHDGRGWPLGHLWSLAVEVQFYILWPTAIWMVGVARSRRILWVLMAVAPLLRLASPFAGPAFNFLVFSDALGAGCLLAIYRPLLNTSATYLRLVQSRWFFLVPLVALAASCVPFTKVYWVVCITVMNIGIVLSADWAMRFPDGFVGRVLHQPVIVFLGVLSYSLYLWQQIFLNRTSSAPYCAFPLNILLALAMALFSYMLIEVPILRLRARFAARPYVWKQWTFGSLPHARLSRQPRNLIGA